VKETQAGVQKITPPGVMAHTYNPSIQETEMTGLKVQ
jgi:hypothetical protein